MNNNKKTINKNVKFKSNLLLKVQIASVIVSLAALTIYNLAYFFSKPTAKSVLGAESNKSNVQIYYWKSFLKFQPNYIDGWLRLTEIEYDSNNMNGAVYALSRALEIDPNSEKVIGLKNKLGI